MAIKKAEGFVFQGFIPRLGLTLALNLSPLKKKKERRKQTETVNRR